MAGRTDRTAAEGGVGSPNSPPPSQRLTLPPSRVHSPPPQKGLGLFDWVCCIVERRVEKESHFPFAMPLPPAGWSQCTLSVPSYDQLATPGQINTLDPLASVTPF